MFGARGPASPIASETNWERDFENSVTDFSRHLYEDMPVCVFYDGHDPSESTTLESSVLRLG
jgi:hypothetical protein